MFKPAVLLKSWPLLFAAAAMVAVVGNFGARAENDADSHAVPLVGALADRAQVEAQFKRGVEAYDRGEYGGAYDAWLPLAQTGDPAAQRNIGHLYRNGLGARQDFAVAAQWYRRAADAGLARAQANLAMMYLRGQGVAAEPAKAARWFRAAALQGHVVAQYNLGLMHLRGLGAERSEAKAIAWLYRAGKAGHEESLETLSQLVAQSPGPEADGAEAAPKAVALAEPPEGGAQAARPATSSGTLALRGALAENAIPMEVTMAAAAVASNKGAYGVAMTRLRPMAETNNAEAQYRLAHLYLKRANLKGDPAYGYFWLARAEISGHPKAHNERTRLDMALERDVLFRGRRILQTWRRAGQ